MNKSIYDVAEDECLEKTYVIVIRLMDSVQRKTLRDKTQTLPQIIRTIQMFEQYFVNTYKIQTNDKDRKMDLLE
jgi:ABC-type antimicrobial peptide transport system permease subunit